MDTIKLYSTPSCAYCRTLKMYLTKHNFNFEDIDVSKDEKALDEMTERSGQMTVPVLDINGTIILGFDKKKINDLLKINE
jgi:glutaredoxin-like YruB-family protein